MINPMRFYPFHEEEKMILDFEIKYSFHYQQAMISHKIVILKF